MDSKASGSLFGGGNHSSTPLGLNSHYFAVPLSCIFSKELIDHTYDSNELDPKVILSFYTGELKQLEDNKAESDASKQLRELRKQATVERETTINLFKKRLEQGCTGTASVFSFLLG